MQSRARIMLDTPSVNVAFDLMGGVQAGRDKSNPLQIFSGEILVNRRKSPLLVRDL